MSAHTADHEAYLRRVLHAAADSLEPNGEGLERIRARLQQPRTASARLRFVYDEIAMRTPTRLQDVAYRAADWIRLVSERFAAAQVPGRVADWIRLVSERFAPAQAPGRHRSRTQGLLRPLAAMAVVMFIVAAGTYVAIDASTAIFPSSSNSQPGGPNAGGHSRAPGPSPSHTSGQGSVAGTGSHPATSPSCKASPKPSGSPSSAAPSQTPSSSPSPAPSDSTSADVSPSPTDSSTTPADSASPAASPIPSANPPTQTTTTPPPAKSSPSC